MWNVHRFFHRNIELHETRSKFKDGQTETIERKTRVSFIYKKYKVGRLGVRTGTRECWRRSPWSPLADYDTIHDWIKRKARVDHQTTLLHVRRLKGMKRSAGEMEKSRGGIRGSLIRWLSLQTYLTMGLVQRSCYSHLDFYCTPPERTENPTPEAFDLTTWSSCIECIMQLQVFPWQRNKNHPNTCFLILHGYTVSYFLASNNVRFLTFFWLGTRLPAHNKIRPMFLF